MFDERSLRTQMTVYERGDRERRIGVVDDIRHHIATIYTGDWTNVDGVVTKVALKRLRQPLDESFHKQAKIWTLQHENMLPFIGTCEDGAQIYLVSPFMERGNAIRYLEESPIPNCGPLLVQVASALEYLAQHEIVHYDLKADKLLIDRDGSVKLAVAHRPHQPSLWPKTPQTDVEALGSLIHALYLVSAPPDELPHYAFANFYPPRKPANCPQEVWQVAEVCLSEDPKIRPPMAEAAHWLKRVSSATKNDMTYVGLAPRGNSDPECLLLATSNPTLQEEDNVSRSPPSISISLEGDSDQECQDEPQAWRDYAVASAICKDVHEVRRALTELAGLEGTNEETTALNILTTVKGGSQRGLFYENVKTTFPRILNGTNQVLLSTSDGRLSVIDEEVAQRSVLVRNALEDAPSRDDVEDYVREPIPLHNVSASVLDKVLEYCERYREEPLPTPNDDSNQDERQKRLTDIAEWDKKFITANQDMLSDIILAANYLDIKPLHDLGCREILSMSKRKTQEESKKLFNIVNGFTPEVEADQEGQREPGLGTDSPTDS